MSNVTPWLYFQSAEDAGFLGAPWSNPQYALAPDYLSEATAGPIGTVYPGQQTTTLRLTQPALGDALPGAGGFILRGVEVEFRGHWTGGSTGFRTAPASAVIGGSVRQSLGSVVLPVGSLSVVFKGGPTDLMGFLEQDIVDPNFGFQIHGTSNTSHMLGNTLRIDSIRARIYWDYPPAPIRGRGRSRTAMVGRVAV